MVRAFNKTARSVLLQKTPRYTTPSRNITETNIIPSEIIQTSSDTETPTQEIIAPEGFKVEETKNGNIYYKQENYTKLRIKHGNKRDITTETYIPEKYIVNNDGSITYEEQKIYTKRNKGRKRENDTYVNNRIYYDKEGNIEKTETYDIETKKKSKSTNRYVRHIQTTDYTGEKPEITYFKPIINKEKTDWKNIEYANPNSRVQQLLKTGNYNPYSAKEQAQKEQVQLYNEAPKLNEKIYNPIQKRNVWIADHTLQSVPVQQFESGYQDDVNKQSYYNPLMGKKEIKQQATNINKYQEQINIQKQIEKNKQTENWNNIFAGDIDKIIQKAKANKTQTGRVIKILSNMPKQMYNQIIAANIMFEVADKQKELLRKKENLNTPYKNFIKKENYNTPYTKEQYDSVKEEAINKLIKEYESKENLSKGDQKRLNILKQKNIEEKAVEGIINTSTLVGLGFASKLIPILVKKGFQASAAYFTGKALRTKDDNDIATAILFAAPELGSAFKFIKRKTPALTREGVYTVAKFPKRPRNLIKKDIYSKERQMLATAGGTTSATKAYPETITRKKGRYATQSLPKSYKIKELPIETVEIGDAFLNPMRNPLYWKRQLKTLVGKQKYGTSPKAKFNPNIFEWQRKKTHIILRNKNITKNFIPPKTKKGSLQPEHEVFDTTTPMKKMFIGYSRDGIKLYYEYPKGTYLPTKLKQLHKNLLSQIHKKDIDAWHVAQRGKEKYNLIEKKNPLGDAWDNSGRTHVTRIQKIGRKLKVKNKTLLDAFAKVHDIYKQPIYNFKTEFAISRGIKKGYYNYIPEIKKLTTNQKKQLAKLVELDEKPPINIGNLRKRTKQTIHYSLNKLTNEEKAIINADRLARFGNKADKDMIFNINKFKKINNKNKNTNIKNIIKKNKLKEIKEAGNIKKEKLTKSQKNLLKQKEYYESYYKNKPKYKIYQPYQNKYNNYKINYKIKNYKPSKYIKNYKTINKKYLSNYIKNKYTKTQTKPSKYVGKYKPTKIKPIYSKYTPTTKTTTKYKPIITNITTTNKKPPRKGIPNNKQKKTNAYQPIYFDEQLKKIIKGNMYGDKKTAEMTAQYNTDKTPITQFHTKRIKNIPLSRISKGIKYNKPHKFRKSGRKTIEKRYYRYDNKGERKSKFDTLAFLAQTRTKGQGFVGNNKIKF